ACDVRFHRLSPLDHSEELQGASSFTGAIERSQGMISPRDWQLAALQLFRVIDRNLVAGSAGPLFIDPRIEECPPRGFGPCLVDILAHVVTDFFIVDVRTPDPPAF